MTVLSMAQKLPRYFAAAIDNAQNRYLLAIIGIDHDKRVHDPDTDLQAQSGPWCAGGRVLRDVAIHCLEAGTVTARHRISA
jgi:hypothetical protein